MDTNPSLANGPICYAHRGARGHVPENTLLAFSLALDLGAHAIECDVQRTRDGELVIIHDGTVDRTTEGTGYVAEMTLAELRSLNAGHRWRLRESIPTLAETLALVERRGRHINLEVKGESVDESVATATTMIPALEALEQPMRERVLVSSFDHPAVQLLKRCLPWLRIALLFGDREWLQHDMVTPAMEAQAEAIHPGIRLVSSELVDQAHEAGLSVNVWTANRPLVIERLLSWRVDGIFSDYPERVIISTKLVSARNR
jgi:glycerophosphoryl diester phosphodiesterase